MSHVKNYLYMYIRMCAYVHTLILRRLTENLLGNQEIVNAQHDSR